MSLRNPVVFFKYLFIFFFYRRNFCNVNECVIFPAKFKNMLFYTCFLSSRSLLTERKAMKKSAPMTDRLMGKALALHVEY